MLRVPIFLINTIGVQISSQNSRRAISQTLTVSQSHYACLIKRRSRIKKLILKISQLVRSQVICLSWQHLKELRSHLCRANHCAYN